MLLHNRIDLCFLNTWGSVHQKGTVLGSASLLPRSESDWHCHFRLKQKCWAKVAPPLSLPLEHLTLCSQMSFSLSPPFATFGKVSVYLWICIDWDKASLACADTLQADKSVWLNTFWPNSFWQAEKDRSTHLVINSDRFNIRAHYKSSQTMHIPSHRLSSITLIFTTGLVHTLSI